jgi:hypothetical protein
MLRMIDGPAQFHTHSYHMLHYAQSDLYVGLLGGAVAGGAPDLLLHITVSAAVFAVVASRVIAVPRAEVSRTCISNIVH